MNRLFAAPTRVVFLGTLLLLIVANHAFYFVTPWHENGDFALNALQIDRAKHLNEFHGNYSRFHFNHPGPAFFYVYAAGELILHDWLRVVPSPHNAHALAGTALQVLFFALALAIAARWVRHPWFLPLALLAAGLHFGFARNAFTSIWPPHVLLMPALCLLIGASSFAAGAARDLPATVLAACLLVHGHVAQPLVVVLVFVAAYALHWRNARAAAGGPVRPWQLAPGPHVLAAAIIALFVLPLFVDLAYGRESNLAEILRFAIGSDSGKSFGDSVLYLLSFLGYFHEQERFLQGNGWADAGFLASRWPVYVAWLVATVTAAWTLRRLPTERAEAPFLRALGGLLLIACAATLVWGLMQTGPMFEFNGHYLYALVYAFGLLLLALVAARLPTRGALVGGLLLAAAGAAALWRTNVQPESANGADLAWFEAVAKAVAADPNQSSTKLLVFPHDEWGDAARTALALKRLKQSYRLDEHWTFIFGRHRTLATDSLEASLERLSVWRMSRQPLPGRSMLLGNGMRVFFDPAPLDSTHAVIEARRGGNLEHYALFGLTSPDADSSWSNLPRAGLRFVSPPAAADVPIAITAAPFVPPGRIERQPMVLHVNGERVAEFTITEPQTVTATIPAAAWNRQSPVSVVFEFPAANSPRRLGMSSDPRRLGWRISKIVFGTAP